MSRASNRTAWVLASMLIFASVALAATPIKNGIYVDKAHKMEVVLSGPNVVTAELTCHGKHYLPARGLFVKRGRFSYHGTADTAGGRTHPPTPTKLKMSLSGRFKTRRLVTGAAQVAGCSFKYNAK